MLRAPARLAAAATAAAVGAATGMGDAGAQDLNAAVSGFAIAPPSGYVARAAAPSSASRFVIDLTKPDESGTGCEVSFEALPGFERFTQDALNRQTDRPGWEEFYREGLGAFYDVRSVETFEHAGVRGAVVFGISMKKPAIRGWIADRPTLIFMLYTPKGLGKVACSAEAAAFEAHRAEFEAVARSLALPR
jgi:hypothetical protein